MSKTDAIAERRGVFHRQDGPSDTFTGDGFAMRLVPPATRLSLRMDAKLASAAGRPADFDLAQPINVLRETQTAQGAARLSARLGPDEWLLLANSDGGTFDSLSENLTTDLGVAAHTVVDISHRNIAIELTGDDAADVLNSGCPLDLADSAFPAGTATRTLFAKAEIVLLRQGSDQRPIFRIECWRSFGRYLHAHLRDAALLIGVDG